MKVSFYKNAQVWVETVLYTLIAFAIIALVLSYVKPEIQELQDKTLVQQSITIMSDLNSIIYEVAQNGEGNKRVLSFSIKKGTMEINPASDIISFEIESVYQYSEPGEDYSEQGVEVNTIETGGKYKINIFNDYDDIFNITYNGEEQIKNIYKSDTFYRLYIENKGEDDQNKVEIELGLV